MENRLSRKTLETEVEVGLSIYGKGTASVETGVGFLDHMLTLLARHSRLDLTVKATGDLCVDQHHLIEDVGIALGQVLKEAIGNKAGMERFGSAMIPMDDALVACSIDLSGRSFFVSNYEPIREFVGQFPTEMVGHFFHSLASEARINLHLNVLTPGTNEHHRVEAIFKAFARALRQAVKRDETLADDVPSTKGVL